MNPLWLAVSFFSRMKQTCGACTTSQAIPKKINGTGLALWCLRVCWLEAQLRWASWCCYAGDQIHLKLRARSRVVVTFQFSATDLWPIIDMAFDVWKTVAWHGLTQGPFIGHFNGGGSQLPKDRHLLGGVQAIGAPVIIWLVVWNIFYFQ